MRSKKWQAFSTRVPPVNLLNLFQCPTFCRNGKRCSRTVTILVDPSDPESTVSMSLAIGGIQRYSMPTMKSFCDFRARSIASTSRQSAAVVQSGFSHKTSCLSMGSSTRKISTCWKLGRQMMTASTSAEASKERHDSWTSAPGKPAASSASRASALALASASATATTAHVSRRSAMLRMCSSPMAPVPTMPKRYDADGAAAIERSMLAKVGKRPVRASALPTTLRRAPVSEE
mmetsp:Transcript_28684/g.98724  ORF Transcript_28684/g.98724 Transcript_28684/m.98724 type:complete len:232 (-) Transcript_28684:57-752(-)